MDGATLVTVSLVAAVAVMIIGLFDMFGFGRDVWSKTGRSRPAWVAITLAFGPLAVLLYWGTVRFDLRDPTRVTGGGHPR